ncbi:MAG TPA: glycosyltransferase family 1 protein [Acidimicrobiales bacterium]|nr:glycosyltransferase family 1 protein [Acidimicrobiales bacterium]
MAVNAEQLLYRSPGGIGRYTAQLLTLLPRLYDDEVVPFTARHSAEAVSRALQSVGVAPGELDRTVVFPLPRPLLYEAWHAVGQPQLGRLHGADLVHAPSVAVPPRSARPLVVTVHDAAPEIFPEAFPRFGRRFHRKGLAAAARRADLVLTGSQAAAGEILEHSKVRADRIRVVPNGIAPPEQSPELRRALLDALGLAGRDFVLWVGSLEPRKGVGTLVEAMARLGRTDTLLVLVGYDGWLGDDQISPDTRARLGNQLRQLGPIGEEQLWALYAEATVFAFPSRHEGFGLPVVEAMSQRTAVLASDIPALREIAAGAAQLVAPDDVAQWASVLSWLLDDPAERERLGAAGVARASLYPAAATIAGIRAVYAELLGR